MINDLAAIQHFLDQQFPQHRMTLEEASKGQTTIRQQVAATDLRPGATVSGPTMMALADAAVYVAILFDTGNDSAVTTRLAIDFLRKPQGNQDVIARCFILQSGRSQVVGRVELYSEDQTKMVAHATVTYALPSA